MRDTFSLIARPETCPRCGARTNIERDVTGNDSLGNPIIEEYHVCRNPACGHSYQDFTNYRS